MANTILDHLLHLAKQNHHWKGRLEAHLLEMEKCVAFHKKKKRSSTSTLLKLLQNVSIEDQIALNQVIQSIFPHVVVKKATFLLYNIHITNGYLSAVPYGFLNSQKDRITLYDAGKFKWAETVELSDKERYKLAKQDFNYHFGRAKRLRKLFDFSFSEKDYQQAAFLLYQVMEQLYTCILLVLGGNEPNASHLGVLRKRANRLNKQLAKVFPLIRSGEIEQFNLLCQAYYLYQDRGYNKSNTITRKTLSDLDKKVQQLSQWVEKVCQKKIKNLLGDLSVINSLNQRGQLSTLIGGQVSMLIDTFSQTIVPVGKNSMVRRRRNATG